MELFEVGMPRKYKLSFVGDNHYPRGRADKFAQAIHELAHERNSFIIGMGDYVEAITARDRRYNPEEMGKLILDNEGLCNMISKQWAMFERDLAPAIKRNRVLGLLAGNHESTQIRRDDNNELRNLCDRTDTRYLGDGFAVLILKDKKGKRLKTVVTHGHGGGVTEGYSVTTLSKNAAILSEADLVVQGHHHKLNTMINIPGFTIANKGIEAKTQHLGNSGSFLTNYDIGVADYGERQGYHPLAMGYIKAEIEDGVVKKFYPVVV